MKNKKRNSAHSKIKRNFNKDNMFQCNLCLKIFNNQTNLKHHAITHTNIKPYSCDLCDKSFSQKVNMMTHRKLHFGESIFTCDICDKKFSQKGNMLTHRRLHTGEHPYPCDLCEQSFVQKISMISHRQSHSDMPNYTELQYKELDSFSCEICNKHFNSKGNYLKHKTKHFKKKLKISISKLRHNSKENIDQSTERKSYKTKYRLDSKSKKSNRLQCIGSNALIVKDQIIKQVRVNIEKLNIDNIFKVWGISVINQHDDIINQVVSNHSVNTESEINLEVTDNTFDGFNSHLTEEDFKNEKIHSKICIPTTDFKVDKEEIIDPEPSKVLSGESEVSNALSAALEINRCNKPTEKDTIDEEDTSKRRGLSILKKKPELEENLFQDLNDDFEENAKGDIMDAKEFLQLDIVCDTNAVKEEGCDLDDKKSDIDIDELLDGDDEDIYNSSYGEVPNILYEELFHDLYSSSQQGEHKKKVVKEVFITTQETEQPKDNLENEGLTDEGLSCFDSSSENQPVLLSSQKVCAYCDLIFSNQRSLDQHMQTIHPTEKPHFCDLCNKSFTRQESLHSHNRSVHFERRENSYSEFQISEQYNLGNKTNFYDTIKRRKRSEGKTFAPELNYNCDKCKIDFRCKDSLLNHKKTCSNENEERKKVYLQSQKGIICSVCGMKFTRKDSLLRHTRTHTDEKPYSCKICKKSFTREDTLILHAKIHTVEKPYSCDICGKDFISNSEVHKHRLTHEKKQDNVRTKDNITCPIRNKRFKRKDTLNKHTITKTFNDENGEGTKYNLQPRKGIVCSVCEKGFTRKDSLTKHMRIHTGEKLYSCDQCKKSFGRKDALIIHSSIHNGEKPHSCDKPFSCEICGKVLTCNNSMKRHKKICENKNQIDKLGNICSICGKSFTRKHSLFRHVRLHTGEKPYACNLCGQAFPSNSHVYKHKSSIHKSTLKIPIEANRKSRNKDNSLPNDKTFFSCEICNKSFIELEDCLKHEQTHVDSYSKRPAARCDLNGVIKEEDKIESSEDQYVKIETDDVNIIKCIKEEECLILGSVEKRFSPILEVVNLSKDNPNQKKQKKNGLTSKAIPVKKEFTTNTFCSTKDKNSYSCKICNEIFDTKNELLKHQMSHLKGIKLQDDFAIIKNGASGVNSVTSAANELVYKCPKDSCGTKMGVYDLKNGRAVQHMIESHQIYPYKMVKLGLSWIKTFF